MPGRFVCGVVWPVYLLAVRTRDVLKQLCSNSVYVLLCWIIQQRLGSERVLAVFSGNVHERIRSNCMYQLCISGSFRKHVVSGLLGWQRSLDVCSCKRGHYVKL